MTKDEKASDGPEARDEKETVVHRRGFFSEGFRHLLRPLADLMEQRFQGLDPAVWEKLVDESSEGGAGGSAYPIQSDYAPPPIPKYLRPPGALVEAEFLTRCSSSNRCVQACPVAAIRLVWSSDPRLNGKPAIDPEVQACVLCEDLRCTRECPTGALRPVSREEVRIGVAVLRREHCLRTRGEDCRICVDKCPVGPRAIDVPPAGAEITVKAEGCTGCGVCQMYCPAQPRAIVVESTG